MNLLVDTILVVISGKYLLKFLSIVDISIVWTVNQ